MNSGEATSSTDFYNIHRAAHCKKTFVFQTYEIKVFCNWYFIYTVTILIAHFTWYAELTIIEFRQTFSNFYFCSLSWKYQGRGEKVFSTVIFYIRCLYVGLDSDSLKNEKLWKVRSSNWKLSRGFEWYSLISS